MYTVIVENDESKWSDKTGELYHFPSRYLKYLTPGSKVIYYKGKIKDKTFKTKRLSNDPHYFGVAEIGKSWPDENSEKNDYYVEIINYLPFSKAIPFKIGNETIEVIPSTRISNYWRDGVREINKPTYDKIIRLAELETNDSGSIENLNKTKYSDLEQGQEESYTSYMEGSKKEKYTTFYERNPKLRQQAVLIHGYSCFACGFNFKNYYGDCGEGFIHIHHLKPISEKGGENISVNPKTDLVPLCPNCHSMVHRKKSETLSIEELKETIKSNGKR
jgi:predicted HNH restriction endonuclease